MANIDKWQVVKNNILESGRALILAELVPLAYTIFVFLLMDFHVFAVVMFGVALVVMAIIFVVYLGACVVNIHHDLSGKGNDVDDELYPSDEEWIKWANNNED